MEILLWLVPSVVVTLVAMVWVAWLGREGRGEVDRDVAVTRLAAAMQREHAGTRHPRPEAPRDRSTGIAVRPSRAPQPGGRPGGGPAGGPTGGPTGGPGGGPGGGPSGGRTSGSAGATDPGGTRRSA